MSLRCSCLVFLLSSCVRPLPLAVEAPFPDDQDQISVRAEEIRFRPCPPNLPAGCELAVLEGNPQNYGLFTLRIRSLSPFVLAPHTHPGAERVTVLSGTVFVGFGARVERARATAFKAGDYYVNKPGALHYVFADEPVTIQITGIGPWVVER